MALKRMFPIWSTGMAYSAEVASATKAGLECCKNKFAFDIPPILQHSNTPAIKANG